MKNYRLLLYPTLFILIFITITSAYAGYVHIGTAIDYLFIDYFTYNIRAELFAIYFTWGAMSFLVMGVCIYSIITIHKRASRDRL